MLNDEMGSADLRVDLNPTDPREHTPPSPYRPPTPTPERADPYWSMAKRQLSVDRSFGMGLDPETSVAATSIMTSRSPQRLSRGYRELKDVNTLHRQDSDKPDAAALGMVLAASIDSMAKLGLRSSGPSMETLTEEHLSAGVAGPTRCCDTPPSSSAAFEMRAILERCPAPKRPKPAHAKLTTNDFATL